MNLFLSLEHRDFRSLDDTLLDETQTEVVFVGILLWTNNLAYQLLYLWHKPHEDKCVGKVERCVEGCQNKRELSSIGNKAWVALVHLGIIAHEATYEVDKRTEHHQYPQHAKDVEEHMGKSRSSSLSVGCEGCYVRGYGGTYIFTHHKGNTLINR